MTATIPIARGAARSMRRLARPQTGSVCIGSRDSDDGSCTKNDRFLVYANYSCRKMSTRQFHHNHHVQRQSSTLSNRTLSTAASDEHDDEPDEEIMINDGLESLADLSPSMQNRVRAMKSRHDEVMRQLHDGGDQTTLGKELSSLSGISSLCDKVSEIHAERESLLELLNETESSNDDEDSKEMSEEINEELSQLELQLQPLSQKIFQSVVPLLNPEDLDELISSDAVIDIRAGTGGDEAGLFAGEIMSAYLAIAKDGGKSWDVEVLSVSKTALGGVKEASLAVSSRGGGGGGGYSGGHDSFDTDSDQDTSEILLQQLGPYGFFQYESGVHRVQRVPVNDVKMQTSAVAVAVLPSVPDNKIASALPSTEIKIDVMRASGAGGQHVNTTESAVRITHIPTGIMAYMQEERSQHKNKAKGLKLVAARVHQLRKEQALKDRSSARSSLMGGGDRSERIRTYNFSQDRITDHRCKVSVQGIPSWLGGGTMVRRFAPHLYEMEREERVVALDEEDEEEERKRKDANRSGKGKAGKKRDN